MPANGEEHEEGSEQSSEEPRPTVWQRLGDAASGAAAATAAGAAAFATATRDGAEALRDGMSRTGVKLDKWADKGMVSRSRWAHSSSSSSSGLVRHAQGLVHAATCALCAALLQVGRGFLFKQRSAKLTTELRAGLITFLMVRCQQWRVAAAAGGGGPRVQQHGGWHPAAPAAPGGAACRCPTSWR